MTGRRRMSARHALAALASAATIASMPAARIRRSMAALATMVLAVVTTWVLAGPAAAQKPLPPRYDELEASKPWTYLMAWALFAGAVLLIGLVALGYLVKSREFRANQRRGGSK